MDAKWTGVSLFTGLSGQDINMYAPNLKHLSSAQTKKSIERAKFSYHMSVMPFGLLIAH